MEKNKNETRYLLGILVVMVGCVLLLEGIGVIPTFGKYIWFIISRLWPLVFIVFGINFFRSKNTTPGLIFILLGISFLIKTLLKMDFFEIFWPVVIIGIGVSLFFKEEKKIESKEGLEVEEKDSYSKTIIFGGEKKKVLSTNYKGGELNVILGELQLDLREVQISKDGAKININSVLSDVEIFVPNGCRVKAKGNGILGNWRTNLKERDLSEPVLVITGETVLGSVKLKD